MNLRRPGLKAKIAVGFGSLLAIIAGMGILGYRSATESVQLSQVLRNESTRKELASRLNEAFLTERIGTRDVLMGRDNETTHLFEHGETDFRLAMDELRPLVSADGDRVLYQNLEAAAGHYGTYNEQVVARYRAGDTDGALIVFKDPQALAASTETKRALSELTSVFDQHMTDAVTEHVESDAVTKRITVLLMVGGLVLGLGIAHLTAYSIVRAVRAMLAMINTVSSNNLAAADMQVRSSDEMGRAARGLNRMKNSLREVILSIARTAEDVSNSSREISTTALQAAGNAQEQKQQMEQIATTVQQMAATVQEISKHSNAAALSASSMAKSARSGGEIVDDVLERMRGIAESVGESAANIEHLGTRSDEIGKIVGVIDEIADQTNLLALNAAIEAARAGEQGQGFAVVAAEVRRLAERTSAATRRIAAVIESVQTVTAEAVRQMRSGTVAVEQGVDVTGKAGESIQRIIGEADKVGSMVAQIAAAATQQASATQQVNARMGQISEFAAESAEGSRLSARACGQLFDLALGLQTMVDRFDVGQRAV